MIEKVLLLLIDDDEVDRMTCLRAIRDLTPEIREVDSGAKALMHLEQERFDCIILDYILPDFDGLSLIKHIRQIGYSTPIVVTTGHGDELLAVEMLKAGAQDYVPKDKLEEHLTRAIESAIEMAKIQSEKDYYINFYRNAPIGFSTTTLKEGVFIKTNPALIKMFDCQTFEQLAKYPVSHYWKYPHLRNELVEIVEKTGVINDYQFEVVTPAGNEKWFSIFGLVCKQKCRMGSVCLPNCPKSRCIESSVIDITEQKKLELEIQRMKEEEIISLKEIQVAVAERLKDFDLDLASKL